MSVAQHVPDHFPRRIAILGGGGFLGSHLCLALARLPEVELRVVDLSLRKLEEAGLPLERCHLLQGSIRDPSLITRALDGCDAVLSLTALCNPGLYNTRPRAVIEASYNDLLPVIDLCRARKIWLLHFSTCEVYGKNLPGEEATPMREDETPLLLGPVAKERWTYACAKQLLERLLWAEGVHSDLAFTIIRPFNVIGPRMDFLAGLDGEGIPRVLACFMRSLLVGEPLSLVDGGAQRRSFLDVSDFVKGILRVLERPSVTRGEILNLGHPGNEVTIRELAEQMTAIFTARYRTVGRHQIEDIPAYDYYGPGYDDTSRRVPDVSKARRLLGWEPETTLEEMLPLIIDDYVQRYAPLLPPTARPGERC